MRETICKKNSIKVLQLFFILALIVFFCYGCAKESIDFNDKYGKELSEAQFYKIEKLYPETEDPVIAYEPLRSIGELNGVKESDVELGNIIYRITFNCKEKVANGSEIIMEIGEKAFTVNGEKFGFSTEEQHAGFLELIGSKYDYYLNHK